MMDLDDAMERLGKWGKWQMIFYVLLCVSNTFPASWHMLAIVFLGGEPDYHCTIPIGGTINDTIPYKSDGTISKCAMFANKSINNKTISCQNGYYYNPEVGKTIVTEWDLVCEKTYMVQTTQTVMVLGVMVGAMGFSAMSDRFGRKPVYLFSQWAMVTIGIITSFASNYYFFAVLRFFAGALQQGIILTGFVMACELFPAGNRTFAGTAIECFWAVGMMLLALFGFLIRDWRMLQLTISIPSVLTIAFYWLLPESIPWLVANQRFKQADKIIKQAAKFNKVPMPDHVFTEPEIEMEDETVKHNDTKAVNSSETDLRIPERKANVFSRLRRLRLWRLRNLLRHKKQPTPEEHSTHSVARYTILDVLKHRKLRMYSLIMCSLWFVNSLVYYGLSLSIENLAGDKYLNFFLTSAVEFPAYFACIFILQLWGRRWPLCIFHIISGIALVITFFIPNTSADGTNLVPLIITFTMIGKFGITGSFGIVFLYAPEIFPTTLRNMGMGIASVGGRLGNMLAPFSSYLAKILPWFPGVVFGALSILVGLLTLLLPETLNRPLPQTLEDIDNWTINAPKQEKKKATDKNKGDYKSTPNRNPDADGMDDREDDKNVFSKL